MSEEPDALEPLRRQPAESLDEWAARLCEFLHARPRPVTDFTRALPELHQHPEVLLDLIALHRILRIDAGETPTAADYATDLPALAGTIRDLFEFEEAVDDVFSDADACRSDRSHGTDSLPALPPRYRFVRWVGSGGFSRVCECIDTDTFGRPVALKLLNGVRHSNGSGRFGREAELIARLNHPHICTLYGFELAHDPAFLVLEFIDGPTVRDSLAAGPLPPGVAARIARDIAAALAHCHADGVVHRDLKPENIKVRPDGVAKLLDLGLARPLTPHPEQWTSGEWAVVGTPLYFSPEHFVGRAVAASDQFSLGVVLYEMLTGYRPFAGDDLASLQAAITTGDPTPLPGLDPRLAGIVHKMLAKRPADRFPSLGEVREALERYLADSDSATPTEPQGRWWRLATASVLVAGSVVGWQLSGEKSPPPQVSQTTVPIVPQPQDLSAVLVRIATDLATVPTPDQEHQRYFRLGHLPPAERGAVRDALTTLVRRMSAGVDVPLADVAGDGTLLRFDLRLLGWRADVEWANVVRRCPLSLRYAGTDLPPAGGTIRKLLNSDLTPFVLADWFVSAASAEPLLSELVSRDRAIEVSQNELLRQFRESYVNTPVDLDRGASELGLASPDRLKTLLASEVLARRLGLSPWREGKPVPRSDWNRTEIDVCPAAELATELKLGIRRIVTGR